MNQTDRSRKPILTDAQLYCLCREYGKNARHWRRRFAGLLPEVNNRSLYRKKGFASIFEFAARLAGMSHEQVRLVLCLERKFKSLPSLLDLLISGKVSANKLVRVAAIATPQNQEQLAQLVQTLSTRALEAFVRDEKAAIAAEGRGSAHATDSATAEANLFISTIGAIPVGSNMFENDTDAPLATEPNLFSNAQAWAKSDAKTEIKNEDHDGSQKPQNKTKSLHVNLKAHHIGTIVKIMEKLSSETVVKLSELVDKNIDIEEIIATALQNREAALKQAKNEAAEKSQQTAAKQPATRTFPSIKSSPIPNAAFAKPSPVPNPPSRRIPAAIKKILDAEQGDRCSAPGCTRPAQVIHHELPFAMVKTHDPNNLTKLCRAHHELKHSINVKFYLARQQAINSG